MPGTRSRLRTTVRKRSPFSSANPSFDVLFTDIRMPGSVDGWGVAEAARRRTPEIKVIYATGLADADRPIGDGEWRFQKPYKIDAVLKILKESGITV